MVDTTAEDSLEVETVIPEAVVEQVISALVQSLQIVLLSLVAGVVSAVLLEAPVGQVAGRLQVTGRQVREVQVPAAISSAAGLEAEVTRAIPTEPLVDLESVVRVATPPVAMAVVAAVLDTTVVAAVVQTLTPAVWMPVVAAADPRMRIQM
jgi:hypothetical protein